MAKGFLQLGNFLFISIAGKDVTPCLSKKFVTMAFKVSPAMYPCDGEGLSYAEAIPTRHINMLQSINSWYDIIFFDILSTKKEDSAIWRLRVRLYGFIDGGPQNHCLDLV